MISQYIVWGKFAYKGAPVKDILFGRNGGVILEAYSDVDYADFVLLWMKNNPFSAFVSYLVL